MAVTLYLVAERTDHLTVTVIAALAHIDVAPCEFEWGVGANTLHLLDRGIDPEERRDFHDAADRHDNERDDAEQRDVTFQPLVVESFARGRGSRACHESGSLSGG